jgi:hypothetical protein
MDRAFFAINNFLVDPPKKAEMRKPSRLMTAMNRSEKGRFPNRPKTSPIFLPLISSLCAIAVQQFLLPFLNTFVDKPAVKARRARMS